MKKKTKRFVPRQKPAVVDKPARLSRQPKWSRLETFADVEERSLGKSPATRRLMIETAPARRIALMLVGLRKAAGLSQKQLGEKTGWHKSYISRLESANGSMPDLETLARYAQACDAQAGVIFGVQADDEMHVIDALTLQTGGSSDGDRPFERLRNNDVELPRFAAASLAGDAK